MTNVRWGAVAADAGLGAAASNIVLAPVRMLMQGGRAVALSHQAADVFEKSGLDTKTARKIANNGFWGKLRLRFSPGARKKLSQRVLQYAAQLDSPKNYSDRIALQVAAEELPVSIVQQLRRTLGIGVAGGGAGAGVGYAIERSGKQSLNDRSDDVAKMLSKQFNERLNSSGLIHHKNNFLGVPVEFKIGKRGALVNLQARFAKWFTGNTAAAGVHFQAEAPEKLKQSVNSWTWRLDEWIHKLLEQN